MFEIHKDSIVFQSVDGHTKIEPWGANSLRIRSSKLPEYVNNDYALLPNNNEISELQIKQLEDGFVIQNGKISCVIKNDGHMAFYKQNDRLLCEEYQLNRVLQIPSRELKPNAASDFKLTLRMTSDADEKFFGMGQYQHGKLNLKGMEIELAQRNTQASIPFALSSKGYGMLWNNPAIGSVTFSADSTIWRAEATPQLDYWITAGDSPAEIEEAYAKVTGTVPMMPDYAMGFWQCKLRYKTQEELLNVAREYKKRGLPLSVIVIDYFHWTEHGDWKFDPRYWPDIPAMVKELKEMGIELMVSVWPTVAHQSENFKEMQDNRYLISTERGLNISMNFTTNTLFYDATNPSARKYVWDKLKKNYFDYGIRTFWLDAIEPEFSVYDFDHYRYYAGSAMQVSNIYPMLCAKAVFDGMREEGVTDTISLARCAWAGSQRYGALLWSGDITSTFDSFRRQVSAGLNTGLAGMPWWTTDIGGFSHGDINSEEFRELLIRWFEYGAYCPVMRLHGTRIAIDGESITYEADNEVWSFGDEAYEICKKYMALREEMKPYIKKQMRKAHEKGTPVMRPLFYDFPHDKACWEIEDQYMFGGDILVAPILYAGVVSREVYLPSGENWTEKATGKIYNGGQTVSADAPIDVIPVFERKLS